MLKVAVVLSVALAGILAVGCSSGSDDTDANVGEANAAATSVAHVNKPTCVEGEVSILSCPMENGKKLAVCAKNVTAPGGFIEYRYGSADRSELTLTYPSSYTDDSEPASESYGLRFDNGPAGTSQYHYDVYSLGGSYAEAGINIFQGDEYKTTLKCTASNPARRLDIETVRAAGVRNRPVDGEGDGRGDGRGDGEGRGG